MLRVSGERGDIYCTECEAEFVLQQDIVDMEVSYSGSTASAIEEHERAQSSDEVDMLPHDSPPEGCGSSVEWKRLLSERETTAVELGRILMRVTELEEEVEERRIELQILEKKREREKRSLLTALRELGGIATADADGDPDADAVEAVEVAGSTGGYVEVEPSPTVHLQVLGCAAELSTRQTRSPKESDREQRYLRRISALEEKVATLRTKLDTSRSREVALNDSARVRGAAYRYATKAQEGGIAATSFVEDARVVGRSASSDLDGLVRMLEGLFVENFRLNARRMLIAVCGGAIARCAQDGDGDSDAGASSSENEGRSDVKPPGESIDLSRFVRNADDSSDDDDKAVDVRQPPPQPPPAPSPPSRAQDEIPFEWGAMMGGALATHNAQRAMSPASRGACMHDSSGQEERASITSSVTSQASLSVLLSGLDFEGSVAE